MALFPDGLTAFNATPLQAPSSFVSNPAGGGRVTTRKHSVVGHQWSEQYHLDVKTNAVDRAWLTKIEDLFYRGSIISNKQHPFQIVKLGPDTATGLVKGAGQSGSFIYGDGFAVGTNPYKAGDLIQFDAGNNVRPIYQITSDVIADAGAGITMSVVPDVLEEFSPDDNSAIRSSGSVSMSCYVMGLQIQPTNVDNQYRSVATVLFRESL